MFVLYVFFFLFFFFLHWVGGWYLPCFYCSSSFSVSHSLKMICHSPIVSFLPSPTPCLFINSLPSILGCRVQILGALVLLLLAEKFLSVLFWIRYSRVTGQKDERLLQEEVPPLWEEQGFSNTLDIERLWGNQEEGPAGSQGNLMFLDGSSSTLIYLFPLF